jgi:hypothetical protein
MPLLERQLVLSDFATETYDTYALCYKCHNRDSILVGLSFGKHFNHIVEEKTACTTCHDSHGVAGQAHLINFNTTYVTPSSSGRLEFNDLGLFHGNCYLTCHGANHNPRSY